MKQMLKSHKAVFAMFWFKCFKKKEKGHMNQSDITHIASQDIQSIVFLRDYFGITWLLLAWKG